MKIPKYLSPSSLKTFEGNQEEFYIKYLATNRAARMPQTQPMSVGSAFDAFVKSYLHFNIFGNYGKDDSYAKDTIFEAQVEAHNRDFAREAGQEVFNRYKTSGCLADIMFELGQCVGKPRFEFSIEDFIHTDIGQIPLLGKPDIFFIHREGARVVLDWKVNGYCGDAATSPAPGFIKVRDTWNGMEGKSSRINGAPHKDCQVIVHKGVKINACKYLEDVNHEWADQLAIYGWLLGETIGSESMIVGIDQIVGCGQPVLPGPPKLRVANHRTRVSRGYQMMLKGRLEYCWSCITGGHYFRHLSLADSQAKCEALEEQGRALSDLSDPMAQFVNECSREY